MGTRDVGGSPISFAVGQNNRTVEPRGQRIYGHNPLDFLTITLAP